MYWKPPGAAETNPQRRLQPTSVLPLLLLFSFLLDLLDDLLVVLLKNDNAQKTCRRGQKRDSLSLPFTDTHTHTHVRSTTRKSRMPNCQKLDLFRLDWQERFCVRHRVCCRSDCPDHRWEERFGPTVLLCASPRLRAQMAEHFQPRTWDGAGRRGTQQVRC